MEKYMNYYSTKDYRILVKVQHTDNKVSHVDVEYFNGRYWKNFLTLGYIMGKKSSLSSTAFGGTDFEHTKTLSDLCSEAFSLLGEELYLEDGWVKI